jgi:hypothetical protein
MADMRRAGRWLLNMDQVYAVDLVYAGIDYAALVYFEPPTSGEGDYLQLDDKAARELFGIDDEGWPMERFSPAEAVAAIDEEVA